jgi:hypothetical protein
MKNIKLTDENLSNIESVLDYLLDSERKSYEEYCSCLTDEICENYDSIWHKDFYNKPEINHIYAIALRVKDSINF